MTGWRKKQIANLQRKKMKKDEIDIMWQQAMRQSIEDGEMYIRYHFAKLVAAKTKSEWVGLTDEQISNLWCDVSNTDFVTADTHVFARAIEAAHGIKENT